MCSLKFSRFLPLIEFLHPSLPYYMSRNPSTYKKVLTVLTAFSYAKMFSQNHVQLQEEKEKCRKKIRMHELIGKVWVDAGHETRARHKETMRGTSTYI